MSVGVPVKDNPMLDEDGFDYTQFSEYSYPAHARHRQWLEKQLNEGYENAAQDHPEHAEFLEVWALRQRRYEQITGRRPVFDEAGRVRYEQIKRLAESPKPQQQVALEDDPEVVNVSGDEDEDVPGNVSPDPDVTFRDPKLSPPREGQEKLGDMTWENPRVQEGPEDPLIQPQDLIQALARAQGEKNDEANKMGFAGAIPKGPKPTPRKALIDLDEQVDQLAEGLNNTLAIKRITAGVPAKEGKPAEKVIIPPEQEDVARRNWQKLAKRVFEHYQLTGEGPIENVAREPQGVQLIANPARVDTFINWKSYYAEQKLTSTQRKDPVMRPATLKMTRVDAVKRSEQDAFRNANVQYPGRGFANYNTPPPTRYQYNPQPTGRGNPGGSGGADQPQQPGNFGLGGSGPGANEPNYPRQGGGPGDPGGPGGSSYQFNGQLIPYPGFYSNKSTLKMDKLTKATCSLLEFGRFERSARLARVANRWGDQEYLVHVLGNLVGEAADSARSLSENLGACRNIQDFFKRLKERFVTAAHASVARQIFGHICQMEKETIRSFHNRVHASWLDSYAEDDEPWLVDPNYPCPPEHDPDMPGQRCKRIIDKFLSGLRSDVIRSSLRNHSLMTLTPFDNYNEVLERALALDASYGQLRTENQQHQLSNKIQHLAPTFDDARTHLTFDRVRASHSRPEAMDVGFARKGNFKKRPKKTFKRPKSGNKGVHYQQPTQRPRQQTGPAQFNTSFPRRSVSYCSYHQSDKHSDRECRAQQQQPGQRRVHFARGPPKAWKPSGGSTGFDKSKTKCFNCGTAGHWSRECRKKKGGKTVNYLGNSGLGSTSGSQTQNTQKSSESEN